MKKNKPKNETVIFVEAFLSFCAISVVFPTSVLVIDFSMLLQFVRRSLDTVATRIVSLH